MLYTNKRENDRYFRGDIFYVNKSPSMLSVGSEEYSARPAIIVSNNLNNVHSDVIEVVYVTSSPKTDLPTHVKITSMKENTIALCEQVCSVSKSRLGKKYGKVSDKEQHDIDEALKVSLGLKGRFATKAEVVVQKVDNSAEVAELKFERDMYKRMYDDLMMKIMNK